MLDELTFDPGKSTGWSHWLDNQLEEQGVIPGGLSGFVEWLDSRYSRTMYPITTLIIEDFIVQPSYVGIAWASEVKGAAVARIAHDKLVIQKRADKATLFHQKKKTDKGGEAERFQWLRARGFDGVSHELDAITHFLVYKKRQRDPYILKKYWNLGN